jgi:serine protease Do
MKRLLALMLSALASLPAWAELDRARLVGLSASVLKIEALRPQGGFSLGSGVVVAAETVVTNCHVIHDGRKISVLRGGVRWPAELQRSDFDRDLCLLRVPGLQASAVRVGRADQLMPGQPVVALGFTGGLGLQNSQGEVLALHRFDGSHVIRSSNWFNSGASGGGLFDEELRLVGILTFRLRGGEAHYFAAPAEWLASMLDAPAHEVHGGGGPARAHHAAYWQRPFLDQPRFLKAMQLQHGDRWPELKSLAAEWARDDASDPEPWYLMSMALARMDRLPEAREALRCSLAAGPASSVAVEQSWAPQVGLPPGEVPQLALAASDRTSAPCVIDGASLQTP